MIKKIPNYMRVLFPLIIVLAVSFAGCQTAATTTPPPPTTPTTQPPATPAAPTVRISSPAAGATVAPGTVSVSIDIANFQVVPPGGAKAAGQGHIHYYRDVTIPTDPGKGAITPADAIGATYKAVQTTTTTWDNIPAGTHTFGVQLVNNDHTPFSPPVTATVTITVGAATSTPPATTPPAASPAVKITSPAAGATVAAGTVSVSVDISNFQIQPPGGANAPGVGHIHYYRDVTPPTDPTKGAVTPADALGVTYKAVQTPTVTWDNVTAGTHTFSVELVNNDHKPFTPPITATVSVTVAGAATTPPASTGPTVSITSPTPGSTVAPGTVTVSINVANFIIQPPGGANQAGYGHIHYYRDVPPPTDPTKGAVTPADALGVTYKAVQTSTVTWDNVTAGSHTFSVQLVNNDHKPFDPPITATVTVTVGTASPATTPPTNPYGY